MTRWLHYPAMAACLLLLWLLLVGSVSAGAVLLGGLLALVGCGTLYALQVPRAHLRRWRVVPGLLRDIAIEVVRSNNAVAQIILRPASPRTHQSGFVRIPLDMRSPYGLSALACILTATPGTLWVDYDSTDGSMLLHVLDLIDEAAWVEIVKTRWERRLMEIFE